MNIVCSAKLKKIPFLNVFLQSLLIDIFGYALVWGYKPSSKATEAKASYLGIPIIRLEDGFLRSFGDGENFPGLSLICDKRGIYYNSFGVSEIESLLILEKRFIKIPSTYETLPKLILGNFLSKYNHTQCSLGMRINHNQKVLVVDQTVGDMSVSCGGACGLSFTNMLDAALIENPSANIYVKTHPEVTSGRKKGYLTHIQDSDRIVMIRDDVNPIDLIQRMDKVYVVTSQMGFEALMCGKPVVCFGVPWYAGWGLTDDRVKDSPAWKRRTKKRTVDELFAAAYIHYTRYLNPFTHKRGKITDVINWLILQKKMATNPFTRDFINAQI